MCRYNPTAQVQEYNIMGEILYEISGLHSHTSVRNFNL